MKTSELEVWPISQSTIADYQMCARKGYYSSPYGGLGHRPHFERIKTFFGTLFHECLKKYYRESRMFSPAYYIREVFREQVEERQRKAGTIAPIEWFEEAFESMGVVEHLLRAYGDWAREYDGEFNDNNLTFMHIEKPFAVPWTVDGEAYTVTGIWDSIVRHNDTGKIYVFETKTTSSPEKLISSLHYDWQPRLYTWALAQSYGLEVAGVIYNVAMQTNPYHIEILNNGLPTRSQAKLIGVDPVRYEQVCREAFIGWGANRTPAAIRSKQQEYETTIRNMRYVFPPLFQRHFFDVTPQMRDSFERQLGQRLKTVRTEQLRGSEATPAWNKFTCNMFGRCPFADVCEAHDRGGDWQAVLQEQFPNRQEVVSED